MKAWSVNPMVGLDESRPHDLNWPAVVGRARLPPSRSIAVAGLLVGLIAAHAIVACWQLGSASLWVDEACSALFARSSVSEIFHTLHEDPGPPLYYLLLKSIRMVAGESEASLRAPSVVFSLVTAMLVWRLGRRLGGDWAGLAGVLLWITSPTTLRMAREARCYSLLACITICLVLAWLRWMDAPHPRKVVAPILLHVAAIYTHNFGLFLLPAAVVMMFRIKGRSAISPLASVLGVSLVCYVPWLPVLLAQLGAAERSIGWVARLWSPLSPVHSIALFCFGAFRPVYLGLPEVTAIIPVIGIVAVAWAAIILAWTWRNQRILVPILLFVGTYLLVPYAVSWILRPIDLPGRTDFPIFPILCSIVGCGVVQLGRLRWLWIGLVVVLGTFWSASVLHPERGYSDREMAAQVTRWAKPDDVVICTGLSRPTMEYYLHPEGKTSPMLVSFPPEIGKMGHLEEAIYLRDRSLLKEQQEDLLRLVRSAKRISSNVLLILTPRPINDGLIDLLVEAGFGHPTDLPTGQIGLSRIGEPCQLVLLEPLKTRGP